MIDPLKCREFKKKSLNGWYIEVEINIKYDSYIEAGKLCVIKSKSKANPQAFRINEGITRTNRKIKFTANHVMFDAETYVLVDVRPTDLDGNNALTYINERTDKTSPFMVYSDVKTIDTAYFVRKTLLEAWEIIEERWGGTFDADNWQIKLLSSVGTDNGETVTYRKDIKSVEIYEDWSNVVTKLYPVGYDGLMLEEEYLEAEIQYEIPYTKFIDFSTELESEEQTEENLLAELKENAEEYIEIHQYPEISYTVSSDINDKLEIGDIVHVLHPLVTIKTEVIEYEYDVVACKMKSITFGNYSRDVATKFSNIKSTLETVSKTVSSQTALINTLNKTGYVYIDENEILILDALPRKDATNVWRWGLGGLGFSSTGYEGPFTTAITLDGQISASFITTGSLDASIITTGVLKSSNYVSGSVGTSINLTTGVIDTANFKVSSSGNITATGGTIGGFTLGSTSFSSSFNGVYDYSNSDTNLAVCSVMGYVSLDSVLTDILDVNDDGSVSATDYAKIADIISGSATNSKEISGTLTINTQNSKNNIVIKKGSTQVVSVGAGGINANAITSKMLLCTTSTSTSFTGVAIGGSTPKITFASSGNMKVQITTSGVDTSSDRRMKDNINGLDDSYINLLNDIESVSFNYKEETEKHFGFIAQDVEEAFNKYNIENNITKTNEKGMYMLNYTEMIPIIWKILQIQQFEIKELRKKLYV